MDKHENIVNKSLLVAAALPLNDSGLQQRDCVWLTCALQLDKREPDVLRLGLCPLYVSFQDCHRFVEILTEALHAAANGGSTTMPDLDFKGD